MKKLIFINLLIFLSFTLLFSSNWKISLNTSLQLLNLNDLEANKDFWNIALYQTVQHKREIGEDIELPQKIESLKYSPAIGISLEKETDKLIFTLSLNKYHSSYNPYIKLGDLDSTNYESTNSVKETLDVLSPSLSFGYKLVDVKNFNISLNFGVMLNFLSFKYLQDFNWTVLEQTGKNEIINIKEKNYTELTKFIPSFIPSIRSSLRFKKIGFSLTAGYNYGKVSNIKANVDYMFSMNSAFHDPIEYTFSGETTLWIGESWVELMGYEYWVKTHLYGDEKPQENEYYRNIRPLEIDISGLLLRISISIYL